MSKLKTKLPLIVSKSPLAKGQLLLLVAVVAMSGAYLASRLYAASGILSLTPSTATVNIGDLVTLQVRENSGTDSINAVQANLTYDATKLQYVSVSETGSAFGLVAATTTASGSLGFARAISGGSAAVIGDNLVTTVTFKALSAGAVPVLFGTGSALVRSTDNVDILAVKNGSTLTLSDLAAPTVPVGLTAPSVNLTSIGLAWAASTDNVGVTGYRVFRNGTQVSTTTTPTYTETGLTPGAAYSYRVSAYDAAGNSSAQSIALVVNALADNTAPSVPGKPTSPTQTMTSITLAWTASTDNVAVTGYRIYRNGTQLAAGPAALNLSYVDSGLAINTSYSYTVAAVDSSNNLSPQTTATIVKTLADTLAPSVPTSIRGTVTNRNIALDWPASTDNVAVTSYNLFRDGVQFASAPSAFYMVVNAPTGSHTYSVSALDAAGNQSAKSVGAVILINIVGDINQDTKVDVFDLSILLSNWLKTGVNTSDLNADSVVNIFDLSILLARWTG